MGAEAEGQAQGVSVGCPDLDLDIPLAATTGLCGGDTSEQRGSHCAPGPQRPHGGQPRCCQDGDSTDTQGCCSEQGKAPSCVVPSLRSAWCFHLLLNAMFSWAKGRLRVNADPERCQSPVPQLMQWGPCTQT